MKKISSIVLLIICCLPVLFIAGLFNTAMVLLGIHNGGLGFLLISLTVIMSLGVTLPINRVQRLFNEKLGIKAPLYFTLAYAPAFAFNTVYAVIFSSQYSGYLADEIYIGYLIFIGEIILAAAIWQLVFWIKSKERIPVKNIVAVALLIVGVLVVSFMLTLLNFFAVLIEVIGYALAVAMTLAASFGIDRIRLVFREKYAINSALFWVFAYVPVLLATMGFLIYTANIDDFFIGVVALPFYISPISNAAFAASGAFWIIVFKIAEKMRVRKIKSE